MSESTSVALAERPTSPKASDQLATFLGIDKGMMLATLKAQCFKGKRPDEVTDEQLAAFVSTANVLQVNPLVPGMLYAYPERNGGITPILGPDGVFKKLDEFIATGKLTGYECEVFMGADGKPERAEATIYRAEGQKPAKYTAWFGEWSVTSNPNWMARPRHMIWVRAIKQAARQVIHGLPMDADEYEIAQMANVTPEESKPAAPVARPTPPPRAPRGAAAVKAAAPAEVIVPESEQQAPLVAQQAEEEAAPVPPHPTPERAFINRDEVINVVCEVVSVKTVRNAKNEAVVLAQVKGGFRGEVKHTGGAVIDGEGEKPNPEWTAGNKLKLKLLGVKLVDGKDAAGNPVVGRIIARVESVEGV